MVDTESAVDEAILKPADSYIRTSSRFQVTAHLHQGWTLQKSEDWLEGDAF